VLAVGILWSTQHTEKFERGDAISSLVLYHVSFERGSSLVGDFGQEEIVESCIGSFGLWDQNFVGIFENSTKFGR
jgi:hypothetical protein